MLRSLVVDGLITVLKDQSFEIIAYADDLMVMVRDKHDLNLSENLQDTLDVILEWCLSEGLGVNPNKIFIILFTRPYKLTLVWVR